MKVLLIVLLISIARCEEDYEYTDLNFNEEEDDTVDYEYQPFKNVVDKIKAQAGSSFAQPDNCIQNCLNREPPIEVRKHIHKHFSSKKIQLNEFFDHNQFRKFCKFENEVFQCFNGCPDSEGKLMYVDMFQLFRFVCSDTNFVDAIPCYSDVLNITWDSCNTINTCRPKRKQLNMCMKNETATNQEIRKLFSLLCDYINCFNDCQYDVMKQKCGKDKTDLYNAFFRKWFQFVTKFSPVLADSNRQVPGYPFQCIRLGLDVD